MNAGPLERSELYVESFCAMMSRRLLKRMLEPVESIGSALSSVQKLGSKVQEIVAGTSVLKIRNECKPLKERRVPDGLCSSLQNF